MRPSVSHSGHFWHACLLHSCALCITVSLPSQQHRLAPVRAAHCHLPYRQASPCSPHTGVNICAYTRAHMNSRCLCATSTHNPKHAYIQNGPLNSDCTHRGLTSRLPCSAAAAAAAEGTLLRLGSCTSDRGLLASATSHASASVSGASGSGCSATCNHRQHTWVGWGSVCAQHATCGSARS
jgi:hypothetical protein